MKRTINSGTLIIVIGIWGMSYVGKVGRYLAGGGPWAALAAMEGRKNESQITVNRDNVGDTIYN